LKLKPEDKFLYAAVYSLFQVPIILIGFAGLGGAHIPPQVSAWIAVFILTLNSAVNPLLYTISSIGLNRLDMPIK
jgi:hypothetical protein